MLGKDKLVHMFTQMLSIRYFEEAILYVYSHGWMPGLAHLYIGQEAVAVGVCENLREEDYITSTHRGHGHLIAKGGDLKKMMAEVMGKRDGYCRGKGGSMHIFDFSLGILGANGIVAGSIPIATGAGLSSKINHEGKVTICFFGEGASNQGAFHEGINLASLWHLPIVYVCENNLYGISVHQRRAQNIEDVAVRAKAYGIPGEVVDGNDVLAVYEVAQDAIGRAHSGAGPTLIECKTYRWGGHHVGDPGTAYRPKEEVEEWKAKCPIKRFKKYLSEKKILTDEEIAGIEKKVRGQVDEAVQFGRQSPYPEPEEALGDVLVSAGSAVYPGTAKKADNVTHPAPVRKSALVSKRAGLGKQPARELTYAQAISEAIAEEMERDKSVILLGEDVGILGGNFRATQGLYKRFGEQRVLDTPVSESGIVGCAIGVALTGLRPIAELMFGDFICVAMDQIVNQCAKIRYMSGGQVTVPLVIRTNLGAGRSSAAQHSQSLQGLLCHTPGLKVVIPSTAYEAKGLLKSAIRDNDPVIFFEHKMMYNKKSEVPEGEYTIPIGVADVKEEGDKVTVIATSSMVMESLDVAERLREERISVEVIDLRTLVPLDEATIINSVRKTGRLVIVDEGVTRYGITAEIAALIGKRTFDSLDAPIERVGNENTPIPFSPTLENYVRPNANKIYEAIKRTLK